MTTPSHILDELQWRCLVHQCTDLDAVRRELASPSIVYVGFDPTSDSLHVGSLLPLMILQRFQLAGHKPIALVGGATGMVGDPSGKSDERVLLSKESLAKNVAGIESQMRRFLSFEGANAAVVVNNYDWMHSFSFLDFLRDIGKNFPVNVMLAKDSVKSRLERQDSGLSFTEFSYMLLQAYDFVYLAQHHDCKLQVGGSDQWGNITAGIDLGRRMLGKQLFGLTCPLLTTSDGRKMGKTEKGAVWLSAEKTSPYEFYQYFRNVSDDDVLMTIRFLSDIDLEEYSSIEREMAQSPSAAQKRLAESMTRIVHGETGLRSAIKATETLFGAEIDALSDRELGDIFSDVPSSSLPKARLTDGLPLLEAICIVGLASSKGEARRAIDAGSVYVNNRRAEGIDRVLTESDLASESVIVLRQGKQKYALLRFNSASFRPRQTTIAAEVGRARRVLHSLGKLSISKIPHRPVAFGKSDPRLVALGKSDPRSVALSTKVGRGPTWSLPRFFPYNRLGSDSP
ncbi:MAG: tyrosine--tRNA ligase [Pirellula sp.]